MAAGAAQKANEKELVQGILAGDSGSFDALYELYERRIYFYALKRLSNTHDAEDLTQDVFLEVFRSLGRYEGRSSLLTWMFGIAHNLACRRFRRRGPSMVTMEDSALDAVASSAAPADRQADFVRVLRNCSRVLEERMSDDQQEAFSLRYIENRSTRDIAEEMGKTNQAIKISLFRTRKTLSQHNREIGLLLSA